MTGACTSCAFMAAPSALVLRGGALGDFLLSLPVLTSLRGMMPNARIELVANAGIGRLASVCGCVDSAVDLESRLGALLFAGGGPDPELCARLGGYGLAISLLRDPDGFVRGNLTRAGIGRVVTRDPIVPAGIHATDYFCGVLEELGVRAVAGLSASLDLPCEIVERGAVLVAGLAGGGKAGRYVAIHPGSGGAVKNWPVDRFIHLAREIERLGFDVVFSVGEADGSILQSLCEGGYASRTLSGLGLEDVAGVLSNSCLYVGNDSGITHLAAAVGAKVLAIFGSTDPAVWAPRGPNASVLRAPAGVLSELSVARVLAEAERITGG